MPRLTRRRLLGALTAWGCTGLAGCSVFRNDRPTESDDEPSPSSTPTATHPATVTLTPTTTLRSPATETSVTAPAPTTASGSTPRPDDDRSVAPVPLRPADGDAEDEFGTSVAIRGDTAVVGAVDDEHPNGAGAGSAYVFERTRGEWRETAKLAADGGRENDEFGGATALGDGVALVGAAGAANDRGVETGAVTAFDRSADGWTRRARLTPPDGTAGALFGATLALSGDEVLVGAPGAENPGGDLTGSAYVFERTADGWTHVTRLFPSDGDANDAFGGALALGGDTAVVGAPVDAGPNGRATGAAYVFERDGGTWAETATLVADDGDANDFFGGAVALADDTVLIGALGDDDPNGETAGSVYAFERTSTGWSRETKLAASDGDRGDWFGEAVALDGDRALVGARKDEDPNGQNAGAAYLFERTSDGWVETAKLAPPDGGEQDWFGFAVAVSDGTALVGAFGDDNASGTDAGAAYVFDV